MIMSKEGIVCLIRMFVAGAVIMMCSSCASHFTGKVYEAGRTHKVYDMPIARKDTVWVLDGKYYVKCTQGECSKVYESTYRLSDFPDCPNTLYWNQDSVNNDVLCRVDAGDGAVKKTGTLHFLGMEEAVPEQQFDFSRARPVGGVELYDRKARYGDYYLIPSGEVSRSAGGYAALLSLPVIAVLDTAIMLPQCIGMLLMYPFKAMMPGGAGSGSGDNDDTYDSNIADDNDDHHHHDCDWERNERNKRRGPGFQMGKDKFPWEK